MLISEMREWGYSNPQCSFCGEDADFGGLYNGSPDIIICPNCLKFNDLRNIGICLGDAILDCYTRGWPIDRGAYASTHVRSILNRLEKQIYRVVADGLSTRHVCRSEQHDALYATKTRT